MRLKEAASVLVVALVAVLLSAPRAVADDALNEQLKPEYLNKVLTLRHFYIGEHLSFLADGSLIGKGEIGPWTVDGQVLVESIEVHGRSLRVLGRRVCLVFDSRAKPYRDVLELIDESEPDVKKRASLEEPFLKNSVEIRIALVSERPELNEVSAAMETVFLRPSERVVDIVPDYWQDYFNLLEGWPTTFPHTTETVYKVNREVSPPRATFQPEPEFTEKARVAKYQGTVTMSLVVDESGKARDICIIKPLGLGLDEKAVDAVRKWKFEPAKKGGEPVPVKIAVEIDFHLY